MYTQQSAALGEEKAQTDGWGPPPTSGPRAGSSSPAVRLGARPRPGPGPGGPGSSRRPCAGRGRPLLAARGQRGSAPSRPEPLVRRFPGQAAGPAPGLPARAAAGRCTQFGDGVLRAWTPELLGALEAA